MGKIIAIFFSVFLAVCLGICIAVAFAEDAVGGAILGGYVSMIGIGGGIVLHLHERQP